ncbi:SEC14 cytosolic factor-like [Papaver somniferum]|uniref:SEC14 cytosolic factor-like n=1 Tax=Papaver somniferum TaxID=3469 RepID=UPI000E6FEC7B|nr:SEC14 cytosolic factor-like [Papaver somniferum]
MDQKQEMAISKMRELVETQGIPTQKCVDHTFLRFLKAKSMNPEKAAKMYVEWKKWREDFVPLGSIPESEIADALGDNKIYLQGLTKIGQQPFLVAKANRHSTSASKDPLQFKKFIVYLFDKAIASSFKDGKQTGNEKIISAVDLKSIPYKSIDARAFTISFQLLKAYFPGRLGKMYMLNAPGFFVSFWKMFSIFLDKDIQENIIFVSNEKEKESFVKEIGEEILPEEYGGRSKLIAIQDVTTHSSINNPLS